MFRITERSFLRVCLIDQRGEKHKDIIFKIYPYHQYNKPLELKIAESELPTKVLVNFEDRNYSLPETNIDFPEVNLYVHMIDSSTDKDLLTQTQHRIYCEASSIHQQVVLILDDTVFESAHFVYYASWGTAQPLYDEIKSYRFDRMSGLDHFLRLMLTEYLSELKAKNLPIRVNSQRKIDSFRWPYTSGYNQLLKINTHLYYKKDDFPKYKIISALDDISKFVRMSHFPLGPFETALMANDAESMNLLLEELKTHLNYFWDFDERVIFVFCKTALWLGHIEILKVFYNFIPFLGIELTAKSLKEFIAQFQQQFRESLIQHNEFEPYSEFEIDTFKNFNANEHRENIEIDSFALSVTSESFYIGVLYHEFYNWQTLFYQSTLLAFTKTRPDNEKDAYELYHAIINCLQLAFLRKQLDIVFFTFAYLPLIEGIPNIANNDPYEFYQNHFILNIDDMFFLSEHAHQKITKFDEKTNTSSTSDALNFFPALQSGKLMNPADYANAYAGFIVNFGEFLKYVGDISGMRKFAVQNPAEVNPATQLMWRLLETHSNSSAKKFLTINGDPTQVLIEAILTNDKTLARICLAEINKKHPLHETLKNDVFIYEAPKFDIKVPSDDVVSLIILFKSLDVLSAFLEYPKCVPLICRYIHRFYFSEDDNKLNDIVLQNKRFHNVLENIVANQESKDFSVLQSPNALAVNCYRENNHVAPRGFYRGETHLQEFDNLFSQVAVNLVKFRKKLKTRTLNEFLGLMHSIRNFLIVHVPNSRTLSRVFIPLAIYHSYIIQNDLRRFPMVPNQKTIAEIASESVSIHNLLNLLTFFFNRIYVLPDKEKCFYIRITCVGFLLVSQNYESLEKNSNKKNVYVLGEFSGRTYDIISPEAHTITASTTPIFPGRFDTYATSFASQASIRDSDGHYSPMGFSFKNSRGEKVIRGFFGAVRNQSNLTKRYHALFTGACIIGATYIATIKNTEGNVKKISVTSGTVVIEEGYSIIDLKCEYEEHVYEKYAKEFFEYIMPIFKSKLESPTKLFAVNVFKYYLNYGIHYYLQGKFASQELFIDYVKTVFEHVMAAYQAYKKIGEQYNIEVVFFSPIDKADYTNLFCDDKSSKEQHLLDVDFNIDEFAKNLVAMMERIPGDSSEQKEEELVKEILNELRSSSDNIAEVYGNIDNSFIAVQSSNHPEDLINKPKKDYLLLDLNRMDYHVMLAVCQLQCRDFGELLGILSADERQVYDGYNKKFSARYGVFDTVICFPTILPQDPEYKTANQFHMNYGIDVLNEMIPRLLLFQGMIAYAYERNLPQLFLYGLQEIEKLISNQATHVIPHSFKK